MVWGVLEPCLSSLSVVGTSAFECKVLSGL